MQGANEFCDGFYSPPPSFPPPLLGYIYIHREPMFWASFVRIMSQEKEKFPCDGLCDGVLECRITQEERDILHGNMLLAYWDEYPKEVRQRYLHLIIPEKKIRSKRKALKLKKFLYSIEMEEMSDQALKKLLKIFSSIEMEEISKQQKKQEKEKVPLEENANLDVEEEEEEDEDDDDDKPSTSKDKKISITHGKVMKKKKRKRSNRRRKN